MHRPLALRMSKGALRMYRHLPVEGKVDPCCQSALELGDINIGLRYICPTWNRPQRTDNLAALLGPKQRVVNRPMRKRLVEFRSIEHA